MLCYEVGRLCCILTPVYYSKRLCRTTWPRWQAHSFIAGCRYHSSEREPESACVDNWAKHWQGRATGDFVNATVGKTTKRDRVLDMSILKRVKCR
jgi:hypothetical protein